MSEQSVASARASVMIFDDVNRKWIHSGTSSGLSKVHIYQHSINCTFRIVGRKLQDQEVVINCAILKGLKYNQTTSTFHQWRDNKQVYGLNFSNREDAEGFASAMLHALDILNGNIPRPPLHQNALAYQISNGLPGENLEDAGYRSLSRDEIHYQERRTSQNQVSAYVASGSGTNNVTLNGHHRASSAPSISQNLQAHHSALDTPYMYAVPPPPPLPPSNNASQIPRSNCPPPPPPFPVTSRQSSADGESVNVAEPESLTAAIQEARLRRFRKQQIAETTSSATYGALSRGTGDRPQILPLASMVDEMAKTLARRRAQQERKEESQDISDQSEPHTPPPKNHSQESSKLSRKQYSVTSDETTCKLNDTNESVSMSDLDWLKQELMREVRRELCLVKKEIIDVEIIQKTDPDYDKMEEKSLYVLCHEIPDALIEIKKTARIKIIEQPASRALRFRYECEGRSAGSLPGVNSTTEKRTFPTICIEGYQGPAVAVVSCVTKDPPYRPHPHNLVGKEGCKRGICTMKVDTDTMTCIFSNLGIQCVKRRDVENSLRTRKELRVDPFGTGFQHYGNVDLNVLRLCFQVFLESSKSGCFTVPLEPVVSVEIYDKKAMTDLVIIKLSHNAASVIGGQDIIILCEKVNRDDIKVRFFEECHGQIVWEAFGDSCPSDVHKQVALSVRTPKYFVLEVKEPINIFVQLFRPSDGATSEPCSFQLLPLDTNIPFMPYQSVSLEMISERKRKKHASNPCCLASYLNEDYKMNQDEIESILKASTMPKNISNITVVMPQNEVETIENSQDHFVNDSETKLSVLCPLTINPIYKPEQFPLSKYRDEKSESLLYSVLSGNLLLDSNIPYNYYSPYSQESKQKMLSNFASTELIPELTSSQNAIIASFDLSLIGSKLNSDMDLDINVPSDINLLDYQLSENLSAISLEDENSINC